MKLNALVVSLLVLLSSGCASASRQAQSWTPLEAPGEVVRLDRDLPETLGDPGLSNAFSLDPPPRRGSKWRGTGTIDGATLYEPVDAQFRITLYGGLTSRTGFDGRLAVSSDSQVVGYYIPARELLIPVQPPFAVRLIPRQ